MKHAFLPSRIFKITVLTLVLAVASVVAGGMVSPAPVSAAGGAPPASCKKDFLGLVPWYQYISGEFTSTAAPSLSQKDPCSIKCFNVFHLGVANDCGQKDSDIPAVLLAVIDDLLRLAAIFALAFIIAGAIKYITSQGDPEETGKAKSTLINALIGLTVALVAVSFIRFIGNKLGP